MKTSKQIEAEVQELTDIFNFFMAILERYHTQVFMIIILLISVYLQSLFV